MDEKENLGVVKEIKRGKNGMPIPGPGKPKGLKNNPEKKARKQLIEEYKDALASALPFISPVLMAKAIQGDMNAIKEVNDILVEKAHKNVDVTSGGKPLNINFDKRLEDVDTSR